MAIYDKKIDAMIKQQITKEVDQVKGPPLDEQWEKFQVESAKRKTKKKPMILQYKWLAAAILLIIIGSYTLFQPAHVNAFGERIIEYINHLVGKTTVNKVINETSTDAPTVGPGTGSKAVYNTQNFSSLSALQSSIDFKIYVPTYLPEGAIFKSSSVKNNNNNSVEINYGIGKTLLSLTQEDSFDNNTNSIFYDIEDSDSKEITINNNQAFITVAKNERIDIIWKIGSSKIQLNGFLPLDEMIKIAESIK